MLFILASMVATATAAILPSPPILTERSVLAERGTSCANSPERRDCWLGTYNIDTDYETTWPTTGVTRHYDLTITNMTLAPDGVSRQVLAINGQIPGPTIYADWGDELEITVHNQLRNNGTSMHWHGARQLYTNNADGVNGITECALAPGDSKTYKWNATFYGTSWYHSHFSAQYGDGVYGTLVIAGPASANYDEDLGPIAITDWYYKTVWQDGYVAERVAPPLADNYLLNGMNANLNGGGNRMRVTFQKGKRYLLRLVNTSVYNHFKFHIDGHQLQVIANDFVPITPYTTDWLNIGIGQRYDVVVTADQPIDNYYMRAACQTSCGSNLNFGINGTSHGVVHYEGASGALPTSIPTTFVDGCVDEPASSLKPVVTKTVPSNEFASQVSTLPVAGPSLVTPTLYRWLLNGNVMNVDWADPTLLQVTHSENNFVPAEGIINIPHANAWTYWIIQNTGEVPHPMHLHGHDFTLLGQANGTFDESMMGQLDFENPTRRDTTMLIGSGWTIIAFITDNPGAWLMHCHIAYHVGEGLSLQFLERQSEIPAMYPASGLEPTCRNWKTYWSGDPAYNKTDSGMKV